ncbi:hypothetical protein [Mycolicibacterium sp. CBMA 361]|uniref:hypothetical protein n=1 Tax=Mycolicibacterium sp. CBMA 361 TaxID=2606610 RepID=UPI001396939A|nr:hypothetical protein [Mycolicibacterium sp. CBMA 361]MUM32158.1 hypothetical protein [Mycolicibacterium sp. CBMA 361]
MTAAGAIPAPPPWWDDKDVTLRAIVPDIDDVAGQLIPYARIGGRAPKTYGTQYRVWGDVAGEKLSYLLTRYPRTAWNVTWACTAGGLGGIWPGPAGGSSRSSQNRCTSLSRRR